MWTLRLPGQSCSPTRCICTVLSTEGEGRAEIKSPLENAKCLLFFFPSSLGFTFFPRTSHTALSLKTSSVTGAHISPHWCFVRRGEESHTYQGRVFLAFLAHFLLAICLQENVFRAEAFCVAGYIVHSVGIYQTIKLFLIKTGWAGTGAFTSSGNRAQVSGRWDWQSGDILRISGVKWGIYLTYTGSLYSDRAPPQCSFCTQQKQIFPVHGSHPLRNRWWKYLRFSTL